MGKDCQCGLCVPKFGQRVHPRWGYDLDEVAKQRCLTCDEPIGDGPYVEETCWARCKRQFKNGNLEK